MTADESYPNTIVHKIAFGSCHKNRGIHHPFVLNNHNIEKDFSSDHSNIWNSILQQNPNVFIWAGDIIYTNRKSLASTLELKEQYDELLTNATIGYQSLLLLQQQHHNVSIIGTWDDHDYGGNDYGNEMPQRKERQDLLLDFLNSSKAFLTDVESPISHLIKVALDPIWPLLISKPKTLAPFSVKPLATSRPIPEPAPVTIAVSPANSLSILSLSIP